MKVKGKIRSANLEEDTVTISLPENFFKENRVRGGEVEIETDCFLQVQKYKNP